MRALIIRSALPAHLETRKVLNKLAKLGAQLHCVPDLAIQNYNSAMAAAEYVAALAGTVTHKANHHVVEVIRSNGTTAQTVVRESLPGVRPHTCTKREVILEAATEPPSHVPASHVTVSHFISPVHMIEPRIRSVRVSQATKHKRARLHAELCEEQRFEASWREHRDKRPKPAPPPMTAADRMEALRRRALSTL